MPEILTEFVSWYLAPWRRINRKEFGIALTIATLPGLLIMLFGWGSGAGHILEPLMNLGNPEALQQNLQQLQSGLTTPATGAAEIDWSGLLNGFCLLAMIPLIRMRLRDMGWFGGPEIALTTLFNISVIEGLLTSLLGIDLLPWGTLWGILNFFGYAWLTFAPGKAHQAVHQRTDYAMPHTHNKDTDDRD